MRQNPVLKRHEFDGKHLDGLNKYDAYNYEKYGIYKEWH